MNDVPELTTCHYCGSTNTVAGEPGGRFESKCRNCGEWFPTLEHPNGCFYGSFGGYSDRWHIPKNVICNLPHGDDAIFLE